MESRVQPICINWCDKISNNIMAPMLFLCAVLVFTASMGVSGAAFTASISPQSVGVDYNSSAVAAFTLSTSGSSVNNIEYSFTINGTQCFERHRRYCKLRHSV